MPNIPAHEVEQLVKSEVYKFLKDSTKLQSYVSELAIAEQKELLGFVQNIQLPSEQERIFFQSMISKITLSDHNIIITLCAENLLKSLQSLQQNNLTFYDTPFEVKTPITLARNVKLAQSRDGRKVIAGSIADGCNMQLIKAITKSFLWHEQIINGEVESLVQIQKRKRMKSMAYIHKIMRLRFLAPDILELIIKGTQPADWMVEKLFKVTSLDWQIQRQQLGLF